MKLKILFDTNVIIDAVSQREGANEYARECYLDAARHVVEPYLSTKQLTDIHDTMRKYVSDENTIRGFIKFLLSAFTIIPVNADILDVALDSPLSDYEDAVLEETTLYHQLNGIVTNSKKDFGYACHDIYSPKELLEITREG